MIFYVEIKDTTLRGECRIDDPSSIRYAALPCQYSGRESNSVYNRFEPYGQILLESRSCHLDWFHYLLNLSRILILGEACWLIGLFY